MCASRAGHRRNLDCICASNVLICGLSSRYDVRLMITQCYDHCNCGDDTKIMKDDFTTDLDPLTTANPLDIGSGLSRPHAPNPFVAPVGAEGTWSSAGGNPTNGHTCSKTCTSINRGCAWASTGDCTCYALPASLFFWHTGDCGPVHHLSYSSKRDLAQQRRSYYLNATLQYAPLNNTTAPPDLPAQLASGMLPSPCNVSYVSFACGDSPDGIVHESLENWLGALLPENATTLPPVPEAFLKIHEKAEVMSSVTVE